MISTLIASMKREKSKSEVVSINNIDTKECKDEE